MTNTRWPGRSGLGNVKTSVMSEAGSARARGPEKWSAMSCLFRCRCFESAGSGVEVGQPAQRAQTGHKAVLTAAVDDEAGQSGHPAPDRTLRDGELGAVLYADQ